ncbi:MAG TPA: DUF308 domain-containing protein [Candidatus Dorea intestinavium]|nr:DUF308 domain-containing protein [Candidatus Dorea intestinavium]
MKLLTIIMGILLILGGIACIFMPGITFLNIAWILGICFLIIGVHIILAYFRNKERLNASIWDLISGGLTVIFGVLLLTNIYAKFLTEAMIIYGFVIWLLATGAMRIIASLALKRNEFSHWIWMFLVGVLTLIIGLYALFHPQVTARVLGYLIGILVMIQGVNLLSFGLAIKIVKTQIPLEEKEEVDDKDIN